MPRRLVVCSDGTWNTPEDRSPTNVIRVARAVLPRDRRGNDQVVFYDRGIGTGGFVDRYVGGITGKGLNGNIQDAYRFLVNNYVAGDELFLFGFSRGAYTMRSLVGLIRNSGLLRKEHSARIPEAFKLYRSRNRRDRPDAERPSRFIADLGHPDVKVKFLGVWDTVGALGIPILSRRRKKYMFHDTTLSSIVENAYHALAIDERRRPFAPTIWKTEPGRRHTGQVWFAGAHSDVGGGYDEEWGLSDIALTWMLDRAHRCGLRVSGRTLAATYDRSECYRVHDPGRGRGRARENLLSEPDEAAHASVDLGFCEGGYAPRNLPDGWRDRLDHRSGPHYRAYSSGRD